MSQGRLPHTGDVFEEDMPSSQKGGEGKADHFPFPVENHLHLIHQTLEQAHFRESFLGLDRFRHLFLGVGGSRRYRLGQTSNNTGA